MSFAKLPLLALGLTWATYIVVERTLLSLSWLPYTWVGAGIVLASLLGMLAAWRAVRRELRRLDAY